MNKYRELTIRAGDGFAAPFYLRPDKSYAVISCPWGGRHRDCRLRRMVDFPENGIREDGTPGFILQMHGTEDFPSITIKPSIDVGKLDGCKRGEMGITNACHFFITDSEVALEEES